MFVINRKGVKEPIRFDKITDRITALGAGLNVDFARITHKVVGGAFSGITTAQLDNLAAEAAASLVTVHYDYSILAANIAMNNLERETPNTYSHAINVLRFHDWNAPDIDVNADTPADYWINKPTPKGCLVNDRVYRLAVQYKDLLNKAVTEVIPSYNYFGYRTLESKYLLRVDGKIVERVVYRMMTVSLAIHSDDVDMAIDNFKMMMEKKISHATPTLMYAGTPRSENFASCFLLSMQEDSIDGIYKTLHQTALISKYAGGVGLSVHNIRATNSYINGTNGVSDGIVPMLKVFNNTARYVNQGGGKRNGSFAIYLEPWHADVFQFLDLRKEIIKEEMQAKDLFYALWIPDLFMKRVMAGQDWTLMCPNECPGLFDVYGDEFEALYTKYEQQGLGRKTVKARELWGAIITTQIETGVPYIVYKDACNRKSNQKNLGTIRSSNLCAEIVQYSSKDEVATCNLVSLPLPSFVRYDKDGAPWYDYKELMSAAKQAVVNLNKMIDVTYYPVEEARNSNKKHRPLGIGVQGLADVFIKMRFPFESQEARELNKHIFEAIYYATLDMSCQLAERDCPYQSFTDSPASNGILQFDMWGIKPEAWPMSVECRGEDGAVTTKTVSSASIINWPVLKSRIITYGLRNSLLTALMPTASTAQILGNNESFEPYTSNIYKRKVSSGDFIVVNPHLVNDLYSLGLWNKEIIEYIISDRGSIQHIPGIPNNIKALYKTVWEISQKTVIDYAADRGAFIDQSQSMNIYFEDSTDVVQGKGITNAAGPSLFDRINSMHFYGWSKGLKTGMYYLRTTPAVEPLQFTIKPKSDNELINNSDNVAGTSTQTTQACRLVRNDKGKLVVDPTCESCGS